MSLKGKPVVIGTCASADDIAVLEETLLAACPDWDKTLRNQTDLKKMPVFEKKLLEHGQHTTYLTECRGTMKRVPADFRSLFHHRFPLPWKAATKDGQFLSYSVARKMQEDTGLVTNEKFRPTLVSVARKGRPYMDAKLKLKYPGLFNFGNIITMVTCISGVCTAVTVPV
jgi:hypothetical protein